MHENYRDLEHILTKIRLHGEGCLHKFSPTQKGSELVIAEDDSYSIIIKRNGDQVK